MSALTRFLLTLTTSAGWRLRAAAEDASPRVVPTTEDGTGDHDAREAPITTEAGMKVRIDTQIVTDEALLGIGGNTPASRAETKQAIEEAVAVFLAAKAEEGRQISRQQEEEKLNNVLEAEQRATASLRRARERKERLLASLRSEDSSKG